MSGFNRSQRRKLEREFSKSNSIERMKQHVRNEVMDRLDNVRIEMLMNCFVIALHEQFGFGQVRCMRVLNAVDAMMVDLDSGEMDMDKLRAMAEEKANIQVCYEDDQIGRRRV